MIVLLNPNINTKYVSLYIDNLNLLEQSKHLWDIITFKISTKGQLNSE